MAGSKTKDGWMYIEIFNYMVGMNFNDDEINQKKFISLILWHADSFNDSNLNMFVGISRKSLKDKFGNDYKTIINALIEKDYIEVNDRYLTKEFPKSYRISTRYRDNERIFVDSRKRQISNYKDQSIIKTENEQYLHDCLRQLIVSKDPNTIPQTKPIRRKLGIAALQHIVVGDVNFRKGEKTNRFFHNFLSMPKEYRECCTYGGEALVTVDIKSAHPTFCYSFYKNIPNSRDEAEKYADTIINHDIYDLLRGGMSREIAKKHLSKFLASERVLYSPVATNFCKEFPLLYSYIIKQDELCLSLQNLESEMVCNRLVTRCREFGYPIITEHDGFRALESHVDTIIEWLRVIIQDECGIYAVLKKS